MNLEKRLAVTFLQEHPPEAALVLERMPADHRAAVVRDARTAAAPALGEMLPSAVADCVARLDAVDAAPALDNLALDRAVAVLRRLPGDAALRTIEALPADKQEQLRRVLGYPEGTAGALMDPMVPELPVDVSVAEARVRLRRAGQGLLHYVYVVDRSRILVGVLEISDLLRAGGRTPVRRVMRDPDHTLPAWMPAAAVRTHPGWDSAPMMPVTDEAGRLLGALRYETLRRLEREGDAGRSGQLATATVGALGELFHLGLAGFIEGVAAAAAPRGGQTSSRLAEYEEGGR